MVEFRRTEPLDYGKVFENIVKGTSEYLTKYGLKAMVLGISGGIDSTVTAAICKEVSKRTGIMLAGFSLPCSTNSDDENDSAALAGKEFCAPRFDIINLQKPFEVMEKFCRDTMMEIPDTPISKGNIKARLRMITLYDIASRLGGIVMDTDNLTENYLGFYTLHGDCCDFNPIGGLWKHEVYGLAKWMKENIYKDSEALDAAIAIVPTDGNGVKAGGDLAQIAPGKTYDDVDEILYAWLDFAFTKDFDPVEDLYKKHGKDTVEKVIMRSVRSDFKRKHLPLVVDIFNGTVTDKDGK